MKRFISLLLMLCLLLSGCSLGQGSKTEYTDPAADDSYRLRAAVLWCSKGYGGTASGLGTTGTPGGSILPEAFLYLSQPTILGLDAVCMDYFSSKEDDPASGLLNLDLAGVKQEKQAERLLEKLAPYDLFYLDESLLTADEAHWVLLKDALESLAKSGASVFVPNAFAQRFSLEFLGASEVKKINGYPRQLSYNKPGGTDLTPLTELVEDFKGLYEGYDLFNDRLLGCDYGCGLVPSTAVGLVDSYNCSLYTMNHYGEGWVYFVNPLLPNEFSVGSFTMEGKKSAGADGESQAAAPFASTTAGFNQLIYSGFAEFAAKKKYGYAIEKVYGYFGSPSISWELHYEEREGIRNNTLIKFSEIVKEYDQIPSYTIIRSSYKWFLKTESISYMLNSAGSDAALNAGPGPAAGSAKSSGEPLYLFDYNENAYSSGAHVDAGGKFLSQQGVIDTTSYFDDDHSHVYYAYPEILDMDGDGILDILSGSSDGSLYFYKGLGWSDGRFRTEAAVQLKDSEGRLLSVDSYSSPTVFDVDGDGFSDILSGSDDGYIYAAFGGPDGYSSFSLWKPYTELDLSGTIYGDQVFARLYHHDDGPEGLWLLLGGRKETPGLSLYYGHMEDGRCVFTRDAAVLASLQSDWQSPEFFDYDGDGIMDIVCGDYNGYISWFKGLVSEKDHSEYGKAYDPASDFALAPFEYQGTLRTNELNYKGNYNIKFGNYATPRFADLNGDGLKDLICGSMEYGLACPIDDPLYECRQELQDQIDYAKANNIYLGVHFYTNKFASEQRELWELGAQKKALASYGMDLRRVGVNQHTWYTSTLNPRQSFLSAWKSGMLWNSGWAPPGDWTTPPQYAKENVLSLPFYLMAPPGETGSDQVYYDRPKGMADDRRSRSPLEETILMQNNSVLHYTPGDLSAISAKYRMPMAIFYHCDYAFQTDTGARAITETVQRFREKYGYCFNKEDQMMLASAAVIHQDVRSSGELLVRSGSSAGSPDGSAASGAEFTPGGGITLRPAMKSEAYGLYDADTALSLGARLYFAENVQIDGINLDADIYFTEENCVTIALNREVHINLDAQNASAAGSDSPSPADSSMLLRVNMAAELDTAGEAEGSVTVRFLSDGMMEALVRGEAFTQDPGWKAIRLGENTLFIKYGSNETLTVQY
jgi:hypothetical protein